MERIRAQLARDQAAQEATTLVNEGRQREAALQTAMGENGIDSSVGSSVVALNALRDKDTLDAMTRIYTGEVEATGHLNEAGLYDRKAQYDRQTGALGAGSKLLGGMFDAFRLAGGLKFGKRRRVRADGRLTWRTSLQTSLRRRRVRASSSGSRRVRRRLRSAVGTRGRQLWRCSRQGRRADRRCGRELQERSGHPRRVQSAKVVRRFPGGRERKMAAASRGVKDGAKDFAKGYMNGSGEEPKPGAQPEDTFTSRSSAWLDANVKNMPDTRRAEWGRAWSSTARASRPSRLGPNWNRATATTSRKSANSLIG